MNRAIGIAGSPRRDGNSTTLMRTVLEAAAANGADTSEVYLNGLVYRGCQGCDRCSTSGVCILDDELTPVLADLRGATAWVLASPVYYDGVSGQMKTFFDRCRTFTRDPATQELRPQLEGDRKGVVILSYEDRPRDDYRHEAEKLVRYLAWMGSFSRVEVMCEAELGPPDAAAGRPDLLARAEQVGRDLVA
jgi:multimeric flavodoxin WrbA